MVAHRSGDREWLATRAPLQNISEGDAKRLAGLFDQIQQTAAA